MYLVYNCLPIAVLSMAEGYVFTSICMYTAGCGQRGVIRGGIHTPWPGRHPHSAPLTRQASTPLFTRQASTLPSPSIGSSSWVGGGQETWNLCGRLWRPSFLWLVFTGPGGAMAPSQPLDMLLLPSEQAAIHTPTLWPDNHPHPLPLLDTTRYGQPAVSTQVYAGQIQTTVTICIFELIYSGAVQCLILGKKLCYIFLWTLALLSVHNSWFG